MWCVFSIIRWMVDAKQKLTDALFQAIREKFPGKETVVEPKHILEEPKGEEFGDYATSIALKLSKEIGKPPRQIAEMIASAICLPDEFSRAELAGSGFINVFFSNDFLHNILGEACEEEEHFGKRDVGKGRKVLVEYSDPNIAKPLGIHHLLATIIGQSLSNIHTFLGYKVTTINYIGDWGTQFGKLVYALKTWGSQKKIEVNPIPELLKLYVRFHEEAEQNKDLEEKARAEFKKLEEGDKENVKLWQWIRDVSLLDIQKTYDRLGGIHFDLTRGESFYRDHMAPILGKGKKLGIFQKGEEGAWLTFFKNEKYPPFMVQKGDGSTLYSTRDLAVIDERLAGKPYKVLYVVDRAQMLYFQQLFETARLFGYDTSLLVHVLFGRMSFPEGRMSTRKGTVILLDEVIDEAILIARKIVEEKNPELPAVEKEEVARKVGIGALKFAVLNQNRERDTKFTWEKMLSLEGESAPYLQYVYARCASILRKAEDKKPQKQSVLATEAEYKLKEPEELLLLRLFAKFPDVITQAAEEYQPSHLARYLSKLATHFNLFYDRHPVLKAEGNLRDMRLRLVSATKIILRTGLSLLAGIEAPNRM